MDINARINWRPGMELTTQTFLDMDENLDFRQQMAIRAALGDHCIGLLPNTPFNNDGLFYTNRFEIERLQCTALLPSGRIVQIDEAVSIAVPMLFGDVYYLAVGIGDTKIPFEKRGVDYVRPQYTYAIMNLEELQRNDVFPLVRFLVKDGVFSIDKDFIPPCLLLSCDPRIDEYRNHYTDLLKQLGEHANFKEGEGKQAMLRYMFRMQSQDPQGQGIEFIKLTQEIAQAVEYFIMKPNREQETEIPTPQQLDPQSWLKWFEEYLSGAINLLDGVTLIDDSIDYEALLAQAKKELYDQLSPELYEKLLERIKREVREELNEKLTESLTKYMDEVMKPSLAGILSRELHQKLYEELYTELFEHLFNALYVTMPEEEEYLPQI
jgi:hypothetical protein